MGQKRLGQAPKLNNKGMNKNQSLREFFIGIDVSKLTFDAALMVVADHQSGPVTTQKFENNPAGLKAFDKWLKAAGVTRDEHTLLVIENTGIYHRLIWQFCANNGIRINIGNAAHIKWSLGLTRGKNDREDSIRLCHYAAKESKVLKAAPEPEIAVLRLKDLHTSRTRLLSQLSANKKYLQELKGINDKETQAALEKAYKEAINGLSKSIKAIEGQIKAIIAKSEALKVNYKLLTTVPGIGFVTAVYIICCTANFAAKPTGKQLACYAGLAPFADTSGTSKKGKPKVHKMANKELKRLLHMGARSAVQHNAEFKQYYERKMGEGKHDLSVINAIKNKMVLRIAAVVNNQRPYVDKHKIAA